MPAPSRPALRAFFARCAISLGLATSLVVAGVVAVNVGIDDRVGQIHRVKLTLADAPPQGENFLLIGSDTRAFVKSSSQASQFGDPSSDTNVQGARSDTLMVAHVEPSAQRTFVVSFPRDLMVDVPGLPGKNRINSAYTVGGAQAVINTLAVNFGIPIQHYLEVDFASFQKIVDTIGHVRVYLPGVVRDEETGVYVPYGAGCYPLGGGAALAWVRSRTLEVKDPNGPIVDPDGTRWRLLDVRADLDRIPRQQNFMRRIASLAISKSLTDPFLAVDLADRVLGYLRADSALSRSDVNALIRAFRTVDVNDPNAVQFETLPVDPDPSNPNVTLVPAAAADAVVAQLKTFGDISPPAPRVSPSQIRVRVEDGTGTGIAEAVSGALAGQGFRSASSPTAATKVAVSEIHYSPADADAAKVLLDYVTDAKLVPDTTRTGPVTLVLGASFHQLTVPTTTTAPRPAGAPAPLPTTTTRPRPTTTTVPAGQSCG